MKLLDIFLLPRRLYQNLTDRKLPLYLGILFVGLADLALPHLKENYIKLFANKSLNALLCNVILAVLFAVVIGLVDVIFFSVPLFDLFKVFRKEKEVSEAGNLRIKLMKIYILAHVIIVPVNIILYFVFPNINVNSNNPLIVLLAYISLLVMVWFSAIISRGINSIYSFQPVFRRVVFLTVFLWNFILAPVLEYIISSWIMPLFR